MPNKIEGEAEVISEKSGIQLIRNPSSHPELQELYKEIVEAGFGIQYPFNWFTSHAIRPDILSVTWQLVKGIIVQGQLPPTLKQMIIIVISAHNQCRYCKVIHTSALESMGVSNDVIDGCITDPDIAQIPLLHRAILKFALKSAKDPNSVTPEDYQILRENNLKDEEIVEIIMVVAFTNFINTWATVSGIALDKAG